MFKHASLLAALIALCFAQNCSDINNVGPVSLFNPYVVDSLTIPTISNNNLPASTCGEQPCSYQQGFTCLKVNYESKVFDNVDCATAQSEGLFPLCYGEATFYSNCTTFECCETLNTNVYNYLKTNYRLQSVSYNYRMYFESTRHGDPLTCLSFSESYDTCYQTFHYFASSDWETCNELQSLYDSFSSDQMAFTLF